MRKSTIVTIALGATLAFAGVASAQTAGGATTAAGGSNGADAKAGSSMPAMTSKSGSPAAKPGHGQSTEHANGKMRAHKNF